MEKRRLAIALRKDKAVYEVYIPRQNDSPLVLWFEEPEVAVHRLHILTAAENEWITLVRRPRSRRIAVCYSPQVTGDAEPVVGYINEGDDASKVFQLVHAAYPDERFWP